MPCRAGDIPPARAAGGPRAVRHSHPVPRQDRTVAEDYYTRQEMTAFAKPKVRRLLVLAPGRLDGAFPADVC
eukprot:COSAG01_NODE_96_length_26789_cov_36.697089_10_plen_72_part_00